MSNALTLKEWLDDLAINGDDGAGFNDYERENDPCLICGETYPPNGLIICDTCGGDN